MTTTPHRCASLLVLTSLVATLSGCIDGLGDAGGGTVSPEALNPQSVVGGTADRAVIARTHVTLPDAFTLLALSFQGGYPNPDTLYNPRVDLVAVDLGTLAVEPIVTDQVGAAQVATDGQYVAWASFSHASVTVRNLNTGDEHTYALGPDPGILGFQRFQNGWFTASVSEGQIPTNAPRLVALNVASGEQIELSAILADGGIGNVVGIASDTLVYQTAPLMSGDGGLPPEMIDPTNETPPEVSWIAIDLKTREQHELVHTVSSSSSSIASGESIYWAAAPQSDGTTTVNTVNVVTGVVADVQTLSASNGHVWSVGPLGAITVKYSFDAGPGDSASANNDSTYWFVAPGGEPQLLVAASNSSAAANVNFQPPQFVGDSILFREPEAGRFVVYDTRDGSQRDFAAF